MITNLWQDLQKLNNNILDDIQFAVNNRIINASSRSVQKAETQASETSQKWAAHHAEGGLRWNSYKAVARRDGVYGSRDFNEQLLRPLIQGVTPAWEHVFQAYVPTLFTNAINDSQNMLKTFEEQVLSRSGLEAGSAAQIKSLKKLTSTYQATIKHILKDTRNRVKNASKDANRYFAQQVQTNMSDTYRSCALEVGPGLFLRMKAIMNRGIEEKRTKMFGSIVHEVQQNLQWAIGNARNWLTNTMRTECDRMQQGYAYFFPGKGRKLGHDLSGDLLEHLYDRNDIIAATKTQAPVGAIIKIEPDSMADNETRSLPLRMITPSSELQASFAGTEEVRFPLQQIVLPDCQVIDLGHAALDAGDDLILDTDDNFSDSDCSLSDIED